MENLEQRSGCATAIVERRVRGLSYDERSLLDSYMDVDPASVYNNCETCNNCGSGDCGDCCSSCDDIY